ncbi:MAG: hypothetical protein COA78_34505 [Blastopirellula sp.]|nr:MAG: hypothetical protein COA78_34505 [Blastopirellula sp.]
MSRYLILFATVLSLCCLSQLSAATSDEKSADKITPDSSYVIVVNQSTAEDAQWQKVVSALKAKHNASVITYKESIDETLAILKVQYPRYTCFVAQPDEVTVDFVAQVHQLTRKLDDDPYIDTFAGILTGYDAANALTIAKESKPLVIKKVASGTDFATSMVEEGLWYDELEKNKFVKKELGGKAVQSEGPDDTTQALVDSLNNYQPDLFITSGHATQSNWQIGFRYKNGYFVSKAGQMYGLDSNRKQIEIDSPSPKVYLPIGNCLMGDINSKDCMALAWMNDVGVRQMIGYMQPTWYGYMGWGVLDYFVEQPGRYTLNEAFVANNHALIHRLNDSSISAADKRGLSFDKDMVAFYGDPKWSAKMANRPKYYGQRLEVKGDLYTLSISLNKGADSFQPVNTNGSQRGGRPLIQFLPKRIKDVKIVAGGDLNPVITDDFILIPNPQTADPDRKYVVQFTAKTLLP